MARLIAILGDVGSGKTALMTLLLNAAYLEGHTVIANYSLMFPHMSKKFAEIADRPAIEDAIWQDAYLGTDELNIGADSYEFFSKRVKDIAFLVTQLRKDNITWLFTVTRFNLIAKRIRDQVDRFICPTDDDSKTVDHKILDQNRNPLYCKGQFHADVYDGDGRFIRRFSFDSIPIRDLYRSNQHIRKDAKPS